MKIQHVECSLVGFVLLVFSAEPVTKRMWCCHTVKPVRMRVEVITKGFSSIITSLILK